VSAAAELRRLVNGYQVSQAIHAAATLGIADLLADGPRASDDLAAATGTDPRALYRLLRGLSSVGVFHEDAERRFALTELGSALRTDSPDSMVDMVVYSGRQYYREAWSSLLESVRTGETAFRLVHGVDVWEYRAQRPEESAIFDRAMAALSRMQVRSVLDAYDFGRFRKIVDVGGPGGKERTREEFAALFDAAGYRLLEVTPTSGAMCVIEGEAV